MSADDHARYLTDDVLTAVAVIDHAIAGYRAAGDLESADHLIGAVTFHFDMLKEKVTHEYAASRGFHRRQPDPRKAGRR